MARGKDSGLRLVYSAPQRSICYINGACIENCPIRDEMRKHTALCPVPDEVISALQERNRKAAEGDSDALEQAAWGGELQRRFRQGSRKCVFEQGD
jgi:hypothetical protein